MVAAVTHLLVLTALGLVTGVWPLDPRPDVAEGFAPPAQEWGAGHRGVDLLGSPGQQVHAAQAGVVTFAGKLAGRGVVVVSHGATRTTYEPVSARVQVGDRVGEGAVIGVLDLFASHCFPQACLHWGLIRGETYLDPLSLVGGGPIRLLPLVGPAPWLSQTLGAAGAATVALPGGARPSSVQTPRLSSSSALMPHPSRTPFGAFALRVG